MRKKTKNIIAEMWKVQTNIVELIKKAKSSLGYQHVFALHNCVKSSADTSCNLQTNSNYTEQNISKHVCRNIGCRFLNNIDPRSNELNHNSFGAVILSSLKTWNCCPKEIKH